jgi:aminoglycoside phosphotransferase (APT) family kinase protein
MSVKLDDLRPILEELDLAGPVLAEEMSGGSSPVYRIDLADGRQVTLKAHRDGVPGTPAKEAYAAALLGHLDVPITRYLLVDETRTRLPFRFAITNYLPGVAIRTLKDEPGIANVYRQMGALQRKLHTVAMPAYGHMNADGIVAPVATNAEFVRNLIEDIFDRFPRHGGDAALAGRLREIVEAQFDEIVPHSNGPVFAHDDLQPGNVLAVRTPDGGLALSGLIDFGNARAADPVFDLAKCLFCSKHEAPQSPALILEGYGPIDHPDPQAALRYYTLLHRMTMWWWLRHIGVIPTADTPSDLIDDLRAMAPG